MSQTFRSRLHARAPTEVDEHIETLQARRARTRRTTTPETRPAQSRTLRSRTSSPSAKLATSREQAKRLLRSVIANQSTKFDVDNQQEPQRRRRSVPDRTVPRRKDTREAREARESSRSTRDASAAEAGESHQPQQTMRSSLRNSVGAGVAPNAHRPSLADNVRNGGDTTPRSGSFAQQQPPASVPGVDLSQRPTATGTGVVVFINLAEPVLYLQGFDSHDMALGNTAMLRGTLHLRVMKTTKIKAITLKFKGRAITRWPEGIPPKKLEFEEIDNIMNHTWPFFNAQFPTAEAGTCADHVELFQTAAPSPQIGGRSPNMSSDGFLSARDTKRLSLQVNQSRSFGKGEAASYGPSVASKGYRTFFPGDYVYNFELPLDSRLPETIDVELGTVKYELEAVVERAGAFKTNLVGAKEVHLIRGPAEGSLEQVEPIAISRNWEDQLHYDIVISGKSFPLGAQVPIAFKLTPLAKVQCHRIKVLVTENIEYFCSNKRVHRMEPTRKLQLFEKRSDAPPTSTFPGSTMRITSGGGIPYDQRARAANGEMVPPQDPSNLLGDLRDESSSIGPTEMEFNVQLPNCAAMKDKQRAQRIHFDTTYTNIQVHHWIKIVMRLSKPDQNDPNKRRHFEISIDSPFHILSCRATQANTSLPAYGDVDAANSTSLAECGCPNAPRRRNSPSSFPATLSALHTGDGQEAAQEPLLSPDLARPQAAHVNTNDAQRPAAPSAAAAARPLHLIRAPSFNPPAFEDEAPPPPLVTPPPQYDTIASPTSGLADYFARLSDAYDDDDDDERAGSSRGRVEVPLTPGSSRVNRSMDIPRTWVPNRLPIAPIGGSIQ